MAQRRPERGRLVGAIAALVVALLASIVATPAHTAAAATTPPPPSALILYDTSGEWGFLGEMYATQTANLAGRFGTYKAIPVRSYTAGLMNQYTATFYLGSTYDEAIPQAFLTDVGAAQRPVVWLQNNIWQLGAWNDAFAATYGWRAGFFNPNPVSAVVYKGRSLSRHADDGPTLDISVTDPTRATTLATAQRSDGTQIPWAVRSGMLTYIGDMPFSYASEANRYLAFADLMFDALAPATAARHRALVRIEDVNPSSDPAQLRAIADYLASQRVPFSVGVSPVYVDPLGALNGGRPERITLKQAPSVTSALKYMQSKGGVLLMHGYTHQYESKLNPYNGVTGDDFEFYLSHIDADDYVILDGPVPNDSSRYATDRINASAKAFKDAGLAVPTIFEFPHYAGSVLNYRSVQALGMKRYERALYPKGVLTGTAPDYTRPIGQFFPYPVRDVYGTYVIPENLGNYEPDEYNHHPPRYPADIIGAAEKNLVVRDGFASFFHHTYFDTLDALKQEVQGIKALGYTFVSATSV